MSKCIRTIASLLLIACVVIGLIPSGADAASLSIKATDVLNIRSQPSVKAAIVGKITKGSRVEVTSQQQGWSKVVYQKKTGWVSNAYLTADQQSKLTGYVNASSLHVRKTATTKSPSIGKLSKGTAVTILKQSGSWSNITVPGKNINGWVASYYVSKQKPADSKSPAPAVVDQQAATIHYVTAGSLNVREQNTTASKVTMTLKKNDPVTLLEKKGTWGKIKAANGKTGWVATSYLTKEKPVVILGTYYVNPIQMNVRESNNTKAAVVLVLKQNETVSLLEKHRSWGKITAKGKTGWVAMTDLSKISVAPAPAPKPVPAPAAPTVETYYVTASSLNVRQGPTTSTKALFSVKKNEQVQVSEKKGSWGKIRTSSGRTGWVSMKYLTTKKPSIKVPTPIPVSNATKYAIVNEAGPIYKTASVESEIVANVAVNTEVMKMTESNGWTQIKLPTGGIGWISSVLLTAKSKNPLQGKTIVIDPGHGGRDPGTSGVKTSESVIALSTSNELAALLRNAGAKVIMTRTNDSYPSLNDRTRISNSNKTDAFISVHYNAANKKSSGIMTFYYHSSYQKDLARYIQQELITSTGMKDLGARYGNFHVIRENKKPAVLLELGFLSNPDEEKIISEVSYHKKAAQGVMNGLIRYFNNK